MSLARKFVDTVRHDMKKVDDYMSGLDPEDIRMQEYFATIPDGDPLLLQIELRKSAKPNTERMRIEQPIMAIKQGNDVMISLSDFILASDFPIFVDGNKSTADGWFIRENNHFHLDLAAKKLTLAQGASDVPETDAIVQDGDILVRGAVLARWFGFDMKTNTQSQILKIVASKPWPVQEKLDRQKRLANKPRPSVALLPLKPDAPSELASPNVDVTVRQSYRKSPNSDPAKSTRYDITSRGDIMGYSAKSALLGNDQERLTSLSVNMSKSSEDTDLLGRLKANFYEFNDINTVTVPLAGPAPQEQGFHVTNKSPYITYDTAITINGDGPPGWDVEIYRGTQFIDGGSVGDNGRYSFPDITMFSGSNEFKILLYGPQGEIREDTKTYSVAPALAGAKNGLYNVSLSRQNSQTYLSRPSTDEDKDALHLAATYERQMDDTLTLQAGLQARKENGDQVFYIHNGAVKVVGKTIYNTGGVVTSKGDFISTAAARRKFGRNSVAASVRYKGDGYNPDPTATAVSSPASQSFNLSAIGPILDPKVRQTGYDFNMGIDHDATGTLHSTTHLGLSGRFDRITANNSLDLSTISTSGPTARSAKDLKGSFSLRGRALNTSWRTTAKYDVYPQHGLTKYIVNLRRKLYEGIDGELNIEHDILPNYTVAEADIDWDAKYAHIGPSFSYDTNKVMGIKLVANFGLTRNPYDSGILMRSTHLTDKGGVAAFVYLDKNGDGVFGAGDEPLPDVFVESVQGGRTAETNGKGEAYLYDLPPSRVTDITVQENSAFDVNWIPGFAGVSVRPIPGHVTRVEFPIHVGGEIDGTIRFQDTDGNIRPARQATIVLLTPEGKRLKGTITGNDGFYYLGTVPPGVYYLTYEKNPLQRTDYDIAEPLKLEIKPDGTTFYGTDILITEQPTVAYRFASNRKAQDGLRPAAVTRFAEVTGEDIYVSLGQFNTRIAMTVAWYRFKLQESDLAQVMGLQTPLTDIKANPETGLFDLKLRMIEPMTLADASSTCRSMIRRDYACEVEIFTHYDLPEQVATGG